jgi:hypothetical protein
MSFVNLIEDGCKVHVSRKISHHPFQAKRPNSTLVNSFQVKRVREPLLTSATNASSIKGTRSQSTFPASVWQKMALCPMPIFTLPKNLSALVPVHLPPREEA